MRILMLFKDIHMSAYAQCAYHKLQMYNLREHMYLRKK